MVAYALGTRVGVRPLAMSGGHSEDDVPYVACRYFSADGLRGAPAAIADAIFCRAAGGDLGRRHYHRGVGLPVLGPRSSATLRCRRTTFRLPTSSSAATR